MKRVVAVVSLAVLLIVPFAVDAQAQSEEPASTSSNPATVDRSPSSSRLLSPQQIDGLNDRAEAEAARLTEKEAQDRRDALDDFKKGAGLGITVVIGDNDDVVDDATVIDNKVVVTRRSRGPDGRRHADLEHGSRGTERRAPLPAAAPAAGFSPPRRPVSGGRHGISARLRAKEHRR